MSEIILLAIIGLIVIGPKELPELARTIGRFMNELKRSTNMLSDEIKQQVKLDDLNLEETLRSARSKFNEDPAADVAEPVQQELVPHENVHHETHNDPVAPEPEQLELSTEKSESEENKKS